VTSPPTGALGRVIHRPRALEGPERCDLCAVEVPRHHKHVLDERKGELLCACQACGLLFERDEAARGSYRLVPDERVRLPELPFGDLGVPVGLAFFVRQPDGAVLAQYPSPAGATRWEVEARAWEAVERRCPPLRDLRPGVQALLVNTARGRREHWLVPIDECYRLVALIRREWRGLSGGSQVWPAIDAFFAELAGKAPHGPRAVLG
jgi:uncharacterized protein DUF5947